MKLENKIYPFKRYLFGVDDAAAGAIIGGAASVIGAGTSAVAQASLNRKTRKFNEEQAAIQRQWSEKMYNAQNAWNYERWLEQNEYNSPEAQVQRMRDAGLNPLFYGLDGSSAGSVSAAQPLSYERASVDNQINPFTAGINAAAQVAQTKLAFASAGKAEKEGDLAAEKAITEALLRDKQYEFLGVQIDLGKSQEKVNDQQARKFASEIHSIEKQVEKMDVDIIETYSKIDVAQRGQKLAEDTFEFTKALNQAKLSLDEKAIAIQWYNANTQRLIGDADIELKGQQKAYVELEGEQVKAVTATENALREGKVERQEIENKTATREYKWMPVEKTIKAVGTAAGIAGGIMLGGKGISAATKTVSKIPTMFGSDGQPISWSTRTSEY